MIVSSRACDASQWRFGDLAIWAIWASRGRESAGVCVLWAFSGMHAAQGTAAARAFHTPKTRVGMCRETAHVERRKRCVF